MCLKGKYLVICLLSMQAQWAVSRPALWVTGPWAAPRFLPLPQPYGPASTALSWTSLEQSTVKCAACPAAKALRPAPPPRPEHTYCTRISCKIQTPSPFSFTSHRSLCCSILTSCCMCTRMHLFTSSSLSKFKADWCVFASRFPTQQLLRELGYVLGKALLSEAPVLGRNLNSWLK